MILIDLIFFLMELCALAAFCLWGFKLDTALWIRIVAGIGAPVVVAVFWGMYVAPKATFPVTLPVRALLQLIVFGLAAAALYGSGFRTAALIYGVIVIIEMILSYTLKR
ncbi:YrdB family protein [Paenibacillus sp. XY044]|uniref:YrdB family protein n=1 Tax=Paenibacillus sp. XY044 TaxID=2026089 RepID=UPI000B992388|nr:YrdB family protein [Paenibacillus sp. XY044]OZB98477.1 hypothetical protein CJP46_04820 [Paenibacillus sp. XY044]